MSNRSRANTNSASSMWVRATQGSIGGFPILNFSFFLLTSSRPTMWRIWHLRLGNTCPILKMLAMISAPYIVLIISLLLSKVRAFCSSNSARFLSNRQSHPRSSHRTSACWARPRILREDEDDQYYDTRYVGDTEEEMNLRNVPLENEYHDDIDVHYDTPPLSRSRSSPSGRDAFEVEVDFWEDDDEYGGDEGVESLGNFWSNPKEGFDRYPEGKTPRSQRRRMPSTSTADHDPRRLESPRKPKSFRSGTPPPPPPVSDFYNRLFWYGFDPSESSSVADKTMFGGTKGKFNGLAYLQDGGGTIPLEQRKRRPRNVNDDYWDGDEEEWLADEARDFPEPNGERRQFRRSVTPPYDPPYPQGSSPTPVPKSAGRPRSTRRSRPRSRDVYEDELYETRHRGDWASDEVASWFDDDEDYDDRGRRSRRRSESSSWSPFNALDVFFGLNRGRLDEQAEEYNRRMGIRSSDRQSRPKPRTTRRKGYAYRYVDEDEEPPVADYEVVEQDAIKDAIIDAEAVEEESQPKRELSWEERALAVERVPPVGVPAWGPTGDLGVDARTKAISDAFEDINEAKRKVKEKEQQVALSKEGISILRVDSELERKRLRESRISMRAIQDRLRRIDRKVEDAARALRYASAQLQTARDELSELEARHWAVLSFYDPDAAEEGVMEALRELEENEPAVRRYREKAEAREETFMPEPDLTPPETNDIADPESQGSKDDPKNQSGSENKT